MTVTQQDILDLSALGAGRYPAWNDSEGTERVVAFTAATAAPTSASSGFEIEGGELVAMLAMDLHVQPSIPRAIVEPSEITDSAAYTVTVDGQAANYTSDADATRDEILAGLKAAVTALSLNVVATTEDIDDDGDDELVIRASDGRQHVFEATNRVTVDAEASRVKFRIWALPYGSTQWRTITPLPDQAVVVALDGVIELRTNAMVRLNVAGLTRIAVEVVDTDGDGAWRLGLCAAEI